MAVTVKLHIPAPPKQTSGRHRAYVSPFTAYALVSEYDPNTMKEITQVGTDLSSSSSACTADSDGSGSRTCTVQIDAMPSQSGSVTDYFEFDTYSTTPEPIASPGVALSAAVPSTNHLGSARTQATITLDASNTVNAALGGVVASYTAVPSTISGDGSQPISGSYSLTALDSSGDVIIAGSADPYTDGVNYPLSFTETDSPTALPGSNSNPPVLTQTPGGPDGSSGATLFSQSADYLSVSYAPNSGASSYDDTLAFTAPSNSPLYAAPAKAVFAPIFLDGSNASSGASFSQNDTNTDDADSKIAHHPVARVRGTRHRAVSGPTTGNNYPIVNFTAAGQSVTITPSEYTGSGPAQTFTPTLSSGCTVSTGTPTGATVSVTAGTGSAAGTFTVTATSTMQTSAEAGYTATDASGQPITACSIAFTDANGNAALLEVTNIERVGPGTLISSNSLNPPNDNITLYNTLDGLSQIAQFTVSVDNPYTVGIEKDGQDNVYVGFDNQILKYTPTSYANNAKPTYTTFVAESKNTGDGTYPLQFYSLAYFETDPNAHTGTLIAGEGDYGRVYVFSTAPSSGNATPPTNNYIQLPGASPSAYGVAFDANGNIFVDDGVNLRIYEYSLMTVANGTTPTPMRTIQLSSSVAPAGLAVDAAGNIFVADSNSGSIYEFAKANTTNTPDFTITSDCTAMEGMNGFMYGIYGAAVMAASDGTDTVYGACYGSEKLYVATEVPNVFTPSSLTSSVATASSTATGDFVAF
jgi:hypothetical protein